MVPGTRSGRKLPLSREVGGVLQSAVPAGGEGPRCARLTPPSPSVGASGVRSALVRKAKEEEGLGEGLWLRKTLLLGFFFVYSHLPKYALNSILPSLARERERVCVCSPRSPPGRGRLPGGAPAAEPPTPRPLAAGPSMTFALPLTLFVLL